MKKKGLLSRIVLVSVSISMALNVVTFPVRAQDGSEPAVICGYEEHEHSDECYEDDLLICEIEEHTHSSQCFEEETLEEEENQDEQPGDNSPVILSESDEGDEEEDVPVPLSDSIITKLEIRLGEANGPLVRDLLNPNDETIIDPDTDYYLYVEFRNPAETSETAYVSLDFGTPNGEANGVTLFNPPGGSALKPGAFDHNYLQTLVSYTDYPNPAYGTGNYKITLVDGKVVYTVKPDVAKNAIVTLATGLVVKSEYCSRLITDAIRVEAGTVSDDGYVSEDEVECDIFMNYDPSFIQAYTSSYYNGTIDSSSVFGFRFWSGGSINTPIVYKEIKSQLKLPAGCVIEDYGFGYNSVGSKESTTYGTLFIDTENPETDGEYAIYNVTISNGYKAPTTTVDYSIRVGFPRSAFREESTNYYKTTILEGELIPAAGGVPVTLNEATGRSMIIYDPNADATTVGSTTRTVYNPTIQMAADGYSTLLGDCSITNSASTSTPYEKTYEAHFNVTNTAAVTSMITVPKGSNSSPTVAYTAISENGSTVSGTIDLSLDKSNSSAYYLFKASDVGVHSFTSVTADIGKLQAGYIAETWTANWTHGSCRAGSYGYFTTDEVGIQVRNTYSLYNTDPLLRDVKNGNHSTYSLVTTTDVAADSLQITMDQSKNIKDDSDVNRDSFTAGNNVNIVNGIAYAYSVPGSSTANGSDRGTASMLVDPVMYLTLPAGFSYSELVFQDVVYNEADVFVSRNDITDYMVENVSYLNTLGDGTSIFRISFPSLPLIGYYDANGYSHRLQYTIKLSTGRTLSTRRYAINDLITFASGSADFTGMKYTSGTTAVSDTMPDRYGINNGYNLAGAAAPANPEIGFGIQGLSEIMVSNAIRISKINNHPVDEESWFTYDPSDPNSIALLGLKSEGVFRVVLKNPGSVLEGTDFLMFIPVPKKDVYLGSAFQNSPFGFDMEMSWGDDLDEVLSGLNARYVKINGQYENVQSNNVEYEECEQEEANAILLTYNGRFPENSEITLNFPFVVNGDLSDLKKVNVWKDSYYYVCDLDPNGKSLVGDVVASEIADGSISGSVFRDENSNGIKDTDDSAVTGVSVVLKDRNSKIYSTVTDNDGKYEFLAVREEGVLLTMKADSSMGQRFNVDPVDPLDGYICTTVEPAADGLSAQRYFEVSAGGNVINGAMSYFHTVSYNGNGSTGGVLPKNQEYAANATATVSVKPDALVKNGYSFTGWNTKADGSGTAYSPGATFVVSEDVVLYAQWVPGTFNVIFNYNGATGGNTVPSKQVVYNQKYGADGVWPVPEKTGYTFRDWGTGNPVNTQSIGTVIRSNYTVSIIQDTTVYAWWNPKTGYTVNYDSDGGSEIESETNIAWDSAVVPNAVPEKNGYDFDGWLFANSAVSDNATYGKLAVSDDVMSVTLRAKWSPKTGYTVTYDTDGGSIIADLTDVSWNQTGLVPSVMPVKDGYALTGWTMGDVSVDSSMAYGDLAEDDSVMSVELKAQWVLSEHNTVHYSTDGGSFVPDKVNVMPEDKNLLPASDPVKAGYTFAGWVYNNTVVSNDTVYSSLSDEKEITLTAKWSKKNYTVSYVSGTDVSIDPKVTGFDDAGLLPSDNVVKNGYVLDGWYLSGSPVKAEADTRYSDLVNDTVENITLEARWLEKSGYVVMYDAAGGSDVVQKSGVSWTSSNLNDASSTRTGYIFAGWTYNGSTVSSSDTYGKLAVTDTVSSITLKASWGAKTGYTVKYNTDGGSEIADKTGVAWDEASLLPADPPVKAGYTFDHWACGRVTSVSAADTFGSMASSDAEGSFITLNAVYTVSGGYTVRYDTNGGSPSSVSDRTNVRWTDVNLIPTGSFTKTGYVPFVWKCGAADVTDSTHYYELTGGEDVKVITLKLEWAPKSGYRVSYDLNGGDGSIDPMEDVSWTDASLIPEDVPSKKGYTFAGWSYEGKPVSEDDVYGDLAKSELEEIVLVAEWSPKPYEVVFDGNGSTAGSMDTQTLLFNIEGRLHKNTYVKAGYAFAGWNTEADGSGTTYEDEALVLNLFSFDEKEDVPSLARMMSQDLSSAESVTLYAMWTEKKPDDKPGNGEYRPVVNTSVK